MASQFSTNTAADKKKALQVRQEYNQKRLNREAAKKPNSAEEKLDELLKEISPMSDLQKNTKPLMPGDTIEESLNIGNRTQRISGMGGVTTTANGTAMPNSTFIEEAERRKNDRNFPGNQVQSEEITAADRFDVGGGQANSIPQFAESGLAAPQSRSQMQFNQGANVQYQDGVNPNARMGLIDVLSSSKPNLSNVANNVPLEYRRDKLSPVIYETKFNNLRGFAEKFKTNFDGLLASDQALQNPVDMEAIQSMLLRNNVSPRTLTELLYNNIAPASQLMDGNSPMGLAGAMILAVLQSSASAKVAQDRRIKDLNQTPANQADLDSWSKDDRDAYRNLENEMYNETVAGQKSIGYLIAQAGAMKMTGNEMALLGEIAQKVAMDTFGEEMFVKLPSVLGDRIQLTEKMAAWVNEDQNMMNYLLNIPPKLPRVGDEGIIDYSDSKTDFRAKGIPDAYNEWMQNKDISTEHFEELHRRALNVLNNTPHTTLNAQSRGLGLMLGFNSQTGEFTNNVLTALFDHKEYKAIQYGGETGRRTQAVSKYDIVTDSMKEMRDFSDTEKDNLVNLNIKAAIEYIGSQIRFDHFVGNNYRFYHEAQVMSPTSHLARSLLGSGSFIKYETTNPEHMMKLKAGIMTMIGMKASGSKMKLSSAFFDARADAFDANIEEWVHKYGDIVEDMTMLDGSVEGAQLELDLVRELQDETSQTAQAMKDLIEYGQNLEGYYTVNAVIEAVKLQQAINKGVELYNSNYMFEVDGTSNGLSINALLTAERDMLAMTGVTEFLLQQDGVWKDGYTYPPQYNDKGDLIPQSDTSGINMLTEPKPPERLTDAIIKMLEKDSSPAKRNLLRIGVKSNLISDSSSKSTMTPAMYGAGDKNAYKIISEAYGELLVEDPSVEKQLLDPYEGGFSSREEIINTLAGLNWSALTGITGNLRTYNGLQTQFMDRILKQYEASFGRTYEGVYDLHPPVTVLDSGYIMRHGEPVQTIHGPELALPANLPGSPSKVMRQMTNMIDPLGKKRNKTTGKLYSYNGALTGAAVKITHHVDAHMVMQMMLRQFTENPGAADGVMGGVLMQMYDGFFGAPMYAEYMDRTLNEEFVNLGYRINNITALVDSAEAQGYDLTNTEMRTIIAEMKNLEINGQNLLKQGYGPGGGLSVNQFQIMRGRTVKSANVTPEGKILDYNFDNSLINQPFLPRTGDKRRHSNNKQEFRNTKIYNIEPGETASERAAKTIEKATRLDGRERKKVKRVDPIRVGNFHAKAAIFKIGDKVVVQNRQIGGLLGKGVIASFDSDQFGKFVGYTVRMENGKKHRVKPNEITADRLNDLPF